MVWMNVSAQQRYDLSSKLVNEVTNAAHSKIVAVCKLFMIETGRYVVFEITQFQGLRHSGQRVPSRLTASLATVL
jgi:hypothetical protein